VGQGFCEGISYRTINLIKRGIFFIFFVFYKYFIQQCLICRPSDSSVSEDAGIESKTVAILAFSARSNNHSIRSHSYLIHRHMFGLDY
jgi:hypothetical protein